MMDSAFQVMQPPGELLRLLARLYTGRSISDQTESSRPGLEVGSPNSTSAGLALLQDQTEQAVGRALLDKLPFGVIAIDGQRRIRLENESGRRSLDRGELLVRAGNQVHPWSDREVPGFIQLVERACSASTWQAEGREILLTRRHWNTSARLLGLRLVLPGAFVLILLLPDAGRERALRQRLMTMFALTASETEVAVLMMCGLSVEQAARQRGVAATTVRGQWQSAQYKVGNDGDSALIDTLLAALVLPPRSARR